MNIIVGLGNPGEKYKFTRHNAGFMAVDAMTEQWGEVWQFNKKFNADIAKHGETLLVKPRTMMNGSGQAVQAVMSYYKLLPKKFGLLKEKNSDLSDILTVIHDDLDLELGRIKKSVDSRSAGHKGVQSVIDYLKTRNFRRIRIGIYTDPADRMPAVKFVLQKFNDQELIIIKKTATEVARETK